MGLPDSDASCAATANKTVNTESTAAMTGASVPRARIDGAPPTDSIIVVPNRPPVVEEVTHRAIHLIRLSALEHNHAFVESAASRQRCSVITVVKADGYGHGAAATALHLADHCGADAFAVATLEEAIALRRAFENNPAGKWSKQLAALFHTNGNFDTHTLNGAVSVAATPSQNISRSSSPVSEQAARVMRPSQIRILVLGPPVGFPRCFDDYYHHNIEVMVSGPEVASALLEWVANENERKRTQVERAAMDSKAQALMKPPAPRDAMGPPTLTTVAATPYNEEKNEKDAANISRDAKSRPNSPIPEGGRKVLPHCSSTLSNVSGNDLAKEVRAMLMNQKAATDAANAEQQAPPEAFVGPKKNPPLLKTPTKAGQAFGGIEVAAKNSRVREKVASNANGNSRVREKIASNANGALQKAAPMPASNIVVQGTRKRIRWHALVDSGMGRLGFKPDEVAEGDTSRRDTVDILKELLDAEIHANAPIEFYGMCTHMADAGASQHDFTHSQISKFTSLLKRVREAGISVPTVSTDNSAALLTTNLTHFDPKEILSQPDTDTRGFVRVGGAIYGQRPAFKQLRAVSTLLASVRHVATLKEGESVGYDRAYIAPYDVRIATLTIGFADGYPRELGQGVGKVAIRGAVFPVAGNVCMDMLMVELGPAEEKTGVGASVVVGDTAVLWGPLDEDEDEGLVRLQDIAATLRTTQSALTCGLDKIRVRRQFV